ncbi:F-box only protein 34 [Eudromia elegans]
MRSSCRAGLHREPLGAPASAFLQAKRVSGMHLKPYLKLQKKERSPEIRPDSLQSPPMSHQRASQEEKYTNSCTKLSVFPKASLVPPSRKLLGIIYPNTMCNMNGKAPADAPSARERKTGPPATIHQGEEGEGPLDVWAVVKPGNTKEKIAFFAAQQCSGGSRLGSMKIKSPWDIDGRAAKRRKKSVDLKKAKLQLERMREARGAAPEPAACGAELCCATRDGDGGAAPGRPLSVAEMVAFLEQRASALLADCAKTCARAAGGQPKGAAEPSEPPADKGPCGGEQQGEPVRVLDMVARLESECLRRQSERDGGGGGTGGLSRNNSLRRSVGRVLLASGTQGDGDRAAAPGRGAGAAEPPCVEKCGPLSGAAAWDGPATRQPFPAGAPGGNGTSELRAEAPRVAAAAGAAALVQSDAGVCGEPGPLPKQHPARKEALCISISVTKTERGCRKDKLWNCGPGEEPLPGRLFFLQGDQPAAEEPQLPREGAPDAPGAAAPSEAAPEPQSPRGGPGAPTEPCALPAAATEGALQVLDASCLKRQVSHDFLETRFKIQQLLEPQQYMAFLPHHIIVKIFGLLPTRSLVALKCTCCYFKFLIEYYNIRPADSRWVRDPRYREDPCKQCKKKYVKGDVSLCRWHPKPYCQALPYGPGYWMCCHRSQKGIPGCKLGLHDNHWVPACHSFNRALHKKARGAGAEAEDEC